MLLVILVHAVDPKLLCTIILTYMPVVTAHGQLEFALSSQLLRCRLMSKLILYDIVATVH